MDGLRSVTFGFARSSSPAVVCSFWRSVEISKSGAGFQERSTRERRVTHLSRKVEWEGSEWGMGERTTQLNCPQSVALSVKDVVVLTNVDSVADAGSGDLFVFPSRSSAWILLHGWPLALAAVCAVAQERSES